MLILGQNYTFLQEPGTSELWLVGIKGDLKTNFLNLTINREKFWL